MCVCAEVGWGVQGDQKAVPQGEPKTYLRGLRFPCSCHFLPGARIILSMALEIHLCISQGSLEE